MQVSVEYKWGRALPHDPNFSQFYAVFWKIYQNGMLASQ